MGIEVRFHLSDMGPEASEEIRQTGALDQSQVHVLYMTQMDDRVRPAHAALHGKVFALADAPVPPLSYGCRCYLEHVAKPHSMAARALPEAPSEPTSVAVAYAEHLTIHVPQWHEIRADVMNVDPAKRLSLGFLLLRRAMPNLRADDARDFAAMILQAEVPRGSTNPGGPSSN